MTMMRARLREMLEKLEQERDELRVRMHLGKAEAKEEWAKLEVRISELRVKIDKAGDEAGDVMEDVGAAAKILGEEIRDGFGRIRRML